MSYHPDYPMTKERFYSLVCAAVDALTNIPEDRRPETITIIHQEIKNMVDEINQSSSIVEKKRGIEMNEKEKQEQEFLFYSTRLPYNMIYRRMKMNAERRKQLAEAISQIEEAKSIIETVATEERDEFEALSEKAQEAEKGVAIEACASSLDEAMDDCDSLINKLNDAKV